ncbi:hypothetical protein ANN_13927 [Periplaneta americana]|uniref:Uncharacterized protein n=1 Tax=Periplaneta americana TaxID=6978 RepID=A0ABQ8SVX0_PERAM|nr:hypothetical protein ANN_13927 [Periplaneta americana]
MAGLCDGGNEPPGSLKPIFQLLWLKEERNFSNIAGFVKLRKQRSSDLVRTRFSKIQTVKLKRKHTNRTGYYLSAVEQ